MKRKRIALEKQEAKEILNQQDLMVLKKGNSFKFIKDDVEHFFEIGVDMITTDVAEAVAILMRTNDINDPIWETIIDNKMLENDINPQKALYWLTGGDEEWMSLKHYNKHWYECNNTFIEEFGDKVINAVDCSKTLKEIRDTFNQQINLPLIYECALNNKLIR